MAAPSGAKELWCTRFGGTYKRNSGLEALGLKSARWRRAVAWVLGLNRKTLGALSCPLHLRLGLCFDTFGPTLTTLGLKGLGCDGVCRTRAGLEPDLWAPCAAPRLWPVAVGWLLLLWSRAPLWACPSRKEDLGSRGKVWQRCRAPGFGPKPMGACCCPSPLETLTVHYLAPVAVSRAVCRLSLNARMALHPVRLDSLTISLLSSRR